MESVQSFERGLSVIRSFGADAPRQTLSDVARRTGLSRATARRLLLTLEGEGYVRREGSTFELTPRTLDLGYAYLSSHTLAELAQPHLRDLSAKVNESTSVAVLDGSSVVYVARVQANRVMTVSIGIGSRFPAYRTSLGRALLAWRSPGDVAAVWEASDRSHPTRRSATTLAQLTERLAEVRDLGYALVDQELEEGVRSVAAPIRDADGDPTAAVNVSTHTSRTTKAEVRSQVVPALLETAEAISTAMTAHRI
ncbi:IclR family transcriptional regulator C-terminal domain-containing protein [Euzebya sp.]|uniref:IclR family transcriptional regulator domain-containing protein n=1 Tax=Euzebya sp. TaxID=1971409 RepID=UPI0035121367